LHRLSDGAGDAGAAGVVVDTLREARSVLDVDIDTLDGPEALRSTVNVQLGLLIAGVAAMRALLEKGMPLDAAAGLSVGAFGAAVACGAIQFADALRLVRLRAQAMRDLYPSGFGMAAISGLDERRVSALVSQASAFMANINAPTQIVICGAEQALHTAMALARQAGARSAQRLPVSVPSHSPLLSAVSQKLALSMQDIEVAAPRIPYISNRRARAVHDADGVREDLILNVSNPVRWHDSVTLLYELGVRFFVEMPPGRVLSDLVQQNFPGARALSAEDARPEVILSSYQSVMR